MSDQIRRLKTDWTKITCLEVLPLLIAYTLRSLVLPWWPLVSHWWCSCTSSVCVKDNYVLNMTIITECRMMVWILSRQASNNSTCRRLYRSLSVGNTWAKGTQKDKQRHTWMAHLKTRAEESRKRRVTGMPMHVPIFTNKCANATHVQTERG